jgi:tetratricopeptide (TPR) repeat protein
LLAAFCLAPWAEAAPSTERDCIKSYIGARRDPEQSLKVLRRCAEEHADSAVIQLTLGRRLLRDFDHGMLGTNVRSEALAALERAAAIDPAQVGEDWLKIAKLHDESGSRGKCLHALGEAETYLPRTEREAIQEQRWAIALELGDSETALRVGEQIRFRHSRDCDAQITVGRLYLAAGRTEDARRSFERALELRPGEPTAAGPLCRILLDESTDASGSDLKLMLDTCRPVQDRLEADELELLIEGALKVFRTEAAEELATLTLQQDADSGIAHLVLAERELRGLLETRTWSESAGHGNIVKRARKALAGDLPEGRVGRAHAVLGISLTYRTLARYRSGGSTAGGRLLASTKASFREALGHLGRAQTEGEPVDGEIYEVRRALEALGVLDTELEQAKLQQRIEQCESLKALARQNYETGRPLVKRTTRALGLRAMAGAGEELVQLGPNRDVKLINTQWTGTECHCRVKTEDGTTGWVPLKALD